jgi:capsular exopolysaccharide synthesis family protein
MIELQLEAKALDNLENPLGLKIFSSIEDIKSNIKESVTNQKRTDQLSLDQIDGQIVQAESRLSSVPGAERRLIGIKRNYSLSENLYVFLAQKRYEAGITEASATADIEVVNPAMVKSGPVYPKTRNNYLIAFLIGLGLPIGICTLIEIANSRIQSKEDLDKYSTIPFIGGVGHKKGETNLVLYQKPKSGLAESFRSLRSNLSYFTKKDNQQIYLITSSISGEGKTFVSINLATAIAFSGRSTLIIEADMRKPKIFKDFKLSSESGLSNFLANNGTFDQLVQDTFIENLKFISSGPIPPNPSELLMRPKMEELLQIAREKFDFIVIDTPPVALVTDAIILSRFVDHMVFITRQNYTPKQSVKDIDDFYKQGKIKNVSLFLNDIKSKLSTYGYNYGYGYGYGYYDDDTANGTGFWRNTWSKIGHFFS